MRKHIDLSSNFSAKQPRGHKREYGNLKKMKEDNEKLDSTGCSSSQNQNYFIIPSKNIRRNKNLPKKQQKNRIQQAKLKKNQKKKKIKKMYRQQLNKEKTKITRLSTRRLSNKAKKIETKQKKKEHKKKIKSQKPKIQEKLRKKTQKFVNKPKSTQKIEKEDEISTVDYVQIKLSLFDRRTIQKKRDDLLKRKVQDWNFMEKLRCDKRQLRMLSN